MSQDKPVSDKRTEEPDTTVGSSHKELADYFSAHFQPAKDEANYDGKYFFEPARTEAEREQRAKWFCAEQRSNIFSSCGWETAARLCAAFAAEEVAATLKAHEGRAAHAQQEGILIGRKEKDAEVARAVAEERQACTEAVCLNCRRNMPDWLNGVWIHTFTIGYELCEAGHIHERTRKAE